MRLFKITTSRIRTLAGNKRWEELSRLVETLHPYDFYQIIKRIEPKLRREIITHLLPGVLAKTLPYLSEELQIETVNLLSPQSAAEVIVQLPPDEIADILGILPPRLKIKIKKQLKKEKLVEIESLLEYHPESAGGLMTTNFVALKRETKVKETIEYLRKEKKELPTNYLYVVDSKDRLRGVLPLRYLILAPEESKLEEIMNPKVISVLPDVDQKSVANLMKSYDLIALPVTDKNGKILGVVTADDVMEVMEKEAVKSIALISGIVGTDSLVDVSSLKLLKARLPWLVVGCLGGIVTAYISRFFEGLLSSYMALVMFIPVLVYMTDALGTQSEAIVVRAMALEPGFHIQKYLTRELKVAAILGVICGAILALAVILGWKWALLALIVWCSLVLSSLLSVLLSTSFPLLLRALKVDPAVASGPFDTILSDLITLVVYFTVASFFLRFLK